MVKTSCLTLGGTLLCSVCAIRQVTPTFRRGSCHRNRGPVNCPCAYCSRPNAQVDPAGKEKQRRTGRSRRKADGAGAGGIVTLDFLPSSVPAHAHANANKRKQKSQRNSQRPSKIKKPASRAARKRQAEARLQDAPLAGEGSGNVDTPPKKQRTWAV